MRVETGTELLLAEVEGPIATITFNDPSRHNVLSATMQRALVATVDELDRRNDVRVVVIRGAGDRAFAAGADIGEFDGAPQRSGQDGSTRTAWNCLREIDKPVLAMIDGYCIGGGLLMALQADLRICSDRSTFAIPAARLGLGYGPEGVRAVMHVAGPAVAADLLFSARRLTAAEAYVGGLVNRVVAADGLAGVVADAAMQIAHNAPLTVRACKAAIRAELDGRDDPAVDQLVQRCWASEDFVEGRRAFAEKREPEFRGA